MRDDWSHRVWRPVTQFLSGGVALALLTFVCFRLDADSTTVALLFLIVIVLVSLAGRFVPSALIAVLAYCCLDYFFTAPLFTLGFNQTLDFVAPFAYVTTAFVITRLISKMRKSVEDRVRAEETLRRSQAELAHVTRVTALGELAASIAHEINQPLSAIVNNGSACLRWLALDPPDLEEARENARDIVRDGKRAGEVITRIRALLRKTDAEKTRLDINQTILEVVALTRHEAAGKGVALRTELSDGLPPVLGDRVQLQQVILNLVMNGVEAMTPSNGEGAVMSAHELPRELHIRSLPFEADRVLVAVRDSGAGIERENLEKVFDAFYTTKPQGLGMGLAISRSIVEDHGGRLWAEPNDGPGTTFQFTLLKYG
jgi:signal transduction histidine kinase